NTHGTGCTLSSALAAQLALTGDAFAAVRVAKAYVAGAIDAADRLDVGSGHGPTHHFHHHW
ncbi:MAG: bifunctional hydroxymethylpyrimidine kinase/phosphomethylpyrimidine kinase, partial [Aurantimonas coralicida]